MSIDRGMDVKALYIYTMDYYLRHKKEWNNSFGINKRMDLTLSHKWSSPVRLSKYYMTLLINEEHNKNDNTNDFIFQNTKRHTKKTN